MKVLVVAEYDNISLKGETLHAVTAASELFLLGIGEVHLLVAGYLAADAAIAACKISGVAKVIYAEGKSLSRGLTENMAVQILQIASSFSYILFSASAWSKEVAARVASKLNATPVCDVISIISLDTFERSISAGNTIETVQSSDAVKVLTVHSSSFDAAGQGGSALIEGLAAVAELDKCMLFNCEQPALIRENIGASENYAPSDMQVGEAGKIMVPQRYIAVSKYLAGIKDSQVIVEYEMDPDASIFSVADYGLTDDLFMAVPELTKPYI